MVRVYRISKVLKVISITLFIFFLGLATYFLKTFFSSGEVLSPGFIGLMIIIFLFVSFMGFQVYRVFIEYVRITSHEIAVYSLFKYSSVKINEVKGYTCDLNPKNSHVILHSRSKKSNNLTVSLDIEDSEDFLLWIESNFKNISEELIIEEKRKVLSNTKYGTTEGGRLKKLNRASKWIQFTSIATYVLGFWLIFLPFDKRIVVTLLSIIPALMIISVPLFKGLITINEHKKEPRPSIIIPFAFPSTLLLLAAIIVARPLFFKSLILPGLYLSVLLSFLLMLICRKYIENRTAIIRLICLTTLYGFSLIPIHNQFWDYSSVDRYVVQVTNKQESTGRYSSYRLTLKPWKLKQNGQKVSVSKAFYDSVPVGSYVSVNVKQGFFSIPWYSISTAPVHSVSRVEKWSEMDFLPEIGDTITSKSATPSMIMSSSSQFYTEEKLQFKGYRFSLGLNDSNEVCYISTNDSTFKTEEGIHIGSTFHSVQRKTNNSLVKEPGWGYYILLPSGWYAGFIKGSSHTEGIIDDGDKVRWLFKR